MSLRQNNSAPKRRPPDPIDENGRSVIELVKAGETVTPDQDSALLPYWYFEKIFDYIVDTQAAQEIQK